MLCEAQFAWRKKQKEKGRKSHETGINWLSFYQRYKEYDDLYDYLLFPLKYLLYFDFCIA